jgi:hypothetical protein
MGYNDDDRGVLMISKRELSTAPDPYSAPLPFDNLFLCLQEFSTDSARKSAAGEFHDQADAKWIVIRSPLWVIMISPAGGQPHSGLSAAPGLAALRAYFVFLVTINK